MGGGASNIKISYGCTIIIIMKIMKLPPLGLGTLYTLNTVLVKVGHLGLKNELQLVT